MIKQENKCPNVRRADEARVSQTCLTSTHIACYYYRNNKDCEGTFSRHSDVVLEDQSCFVATACYGEHDHITDSLRNWRDRMRKEQNIRAIKFIDFYYAGFGYNAANILKKVPVLKLIARWFILLFKRVVGA